METAAPPSSPIALPAGISEQDIRPAPLVRPGVWVEALDVILAGTTTGQCTERRWGSYAAPDAASAIRWMRVSVRTVTPILGPLQSSYVLDNWVRGPQSLADYHRLCRGRDCSLTVCRDGIETVWRARPARFLHIAAVNGGPVSDGLFWPHRNGLFWLRQVFDRRAVGDPRTSAASEKRPSGARVNGRPTVRRGGAARSVPLGPTNPVQDSTLYQPVDGVPVPVRKDFVRYDVGPALRWIVATQLACALYDCTLLDPAVLAA